MTENYISLLKRLLQSSGMSQAQLAGRLGITFAALNRWLNGRARPRPKKIVAIERLHLELVRYPAYENASMAQNIKAAQKQKRPGLWKLIAQNEALQDDLLLEHTYNSTAIEGTTFSKHQTEAVLFSKKILPDKSLVEHLEVTNHAAVLRKILRGDHDLPVSELSIKELHRGLLQGIRFDAGEYSKHHRVVRGVEIALTHPADIPEEMARLIRRWKRNRRITLREIALFHVELELIHPFGDGNGRVGRLIMTLQCLQRDYPPVVIENARKAEYYEVLEYAQRKSEGPFIAFLVEELGETSKILKKHRIR